MTCETGFQVSNKPVLYTMQLKMHFGQTLVKELVSLRRYDVWFWCGDHVRRSANCGGLWHCHRAVSFTFVIPHLSTSNCLSRSFWISWGFRWLHKQGIWGKKSWTKWTERVVFITKSSKQRASFRYFRRPRIGVHDPEDAAWRHTGTVLKNWRQRTEDSAGKWFS